MSRNRSDNDISSADLELIGAVLVAIGDVIEVLAILKARQEELLEQLEGNKE